MIFECDLVGSATFNMADVLAKGVLPADAAESSADGGGLLVKKCKVTKDKRDVHDGVNASYVQVASEEVLSGAGNVMAVASLVSDDADQPVFELGRTEIRLEHSPTFEAPISFANNDDTVEPPQIQIDIYHCPGFSAGSDVRPADLNTIFECDLIGRERFRLGEILEEKFEVEPNTMTKELLNEADPSLSWRLGGASVTIRAEEQEAGNGSPLVVVRELGPNGGPAKEVGRTEVIANNRNPTFKLETSLKARFGETQMLRFDLYYADPEAAKRDDGIELNVLFECDYIGSVECSLQTIADKKRMGVEFSNTEDVGAQLTGSMLNITCVPLPLNRTSPILVVYRMKDVNDVNPKEMARTELLRDPENVQVYENPIFTKTLPISWSMCPKELIDCRVYCALPGCEDVPAAELNVLFECDCIGGALCKLTALMHSDEGEHRNINQTGTWGFISVPIRNMKNKLVRHRLKLANSSVQLNIAEPWTIAGSPIIVASRMQGSEGQGAIELGRTEVIAHETNPEFETRVPVSAKFGASQHIRFDMYFADPEAADDERVVNVLYESDHVGHFQCSMDELLAVDAAERPLTFADNERWEYDESLVCTLSFQIKKRRTTRGAPVVVVGLRSKENGDGVRDMGCTETAVPSKRSEKDHTSLFRHRPLYCDFGLITP